MAGKFTRRELLKARRARGRGPLVPVHPLPIRARRARSIRRAIKKFGSSLKGHLILPGDKEYESARRLWNARYDKHPAMIARCAATEDVRSSIEFARKNGLVVSIRSGGHDTAGFSGNDGGIVIDLGHMNAIQVDPQQGKVSAQPGVHVGQLYDTLGEHGVVAVSGTCPTVGIGGLTTGGGTGWISNKYGTASDNVLGAEVVTADSRVLRAAADENSDLFWAIRGGSGNFGVVTGFELRTIPMAHVLKGSLAFPASRCREVLRFCREFAATAPEELTLGITYGIPGPADQIFLTVCYCGDPDESEAVLKPLRSFAKPGTDDIHTVPAHLGLLDEEPPSLANFEGDAVVPLLSDANIDVLSEAVNGAPSLYSLEVFAFGSGITRGTGSYPFRFAFLEVDYTAFWRDAKDSEAAGKWVDGLGKAITPSSKGGYVNSIGVPDQARAAFGQNWDRLVAIKNKYDPTNFFRMNQNIKPTV